MGYSQQEIDEKLKQIRKNIEGNAEQIEKAMQMLQKMAQYDIGKRTLMQMPLNIKIIINSSLENENKGSYNDRNKAVVVRKCNDETEYIITLAHEMRHAIQHADERGVLSDRFSQERFIEKKLCELETRLQNIILESLLKPKEDISKSAACLFYESEIKRFHETQNLPLKEAERAARTSLVQIYWSHSNEIPDGCSNITEELSYNIKDWNNNYDLYAFSWRKNNDIVFDKEPLELKTKILKLAEHKTQKDFDADLKQHPSLEKNEKAHFKKVLIKYVQEMDINLSGDWFVDIQNKNSVVGDFFVVNKYPNGARQSELIALSDGYLINEFATDGNFVLAEIKYDCDYATAQIVEYYENGQKKIEFPYIKGIKNGVDIYYYENGKRFLEVPFVNGIKSGLGMKYYEGGQKKAEIPYASGKENGIEVGYYENGVKKYEVPFVDDTEEGVEIKYYENGAKKCEISWKNGKKDGIEKEYDENGNLLSEKNYRNGVLCES